MKRKTKAFCVRATPRAEESLVYLADLWQVSLSEAWRRTLIERAEAEQSKGIALPMQFMVVCSKCGNKRCPHAADKKNECTNSNEPGQRRSNYE